jgi:acetyl-CoA carboxylase biotin carboxyl carrier protein
MNLKELRELIQIVTSEATIEEFELERSGVRVHIRRSGARSAAAGISPLAETAPGATGTVSTPLPEAVPETEGGEEADAGQHRITSPMVGTFYRAPSPDAEPFVRVGDVIEKGTVVCIIEAMKLMNEIESDVAGEIVRIPVENGHPVEYGEPLLVVRPH